MSLTNHVIKARLLSLLFYMLFALGIASLTNVAQARGCYTQSAFGLQFGAVGPGGGQGTSQISLSCQSDGSQGPTLYYHMCLYINPGRHSSIGGPRRMINEGGATASYLNYMLYSDPQHSSVLDGAAAGGEPARLAMVVPPRPGPLQGQISVYGSVLQGQSVRAGRYTEHGVTGVLRYRYDVKPFVASDDCLSGGAGGGNDGSLQSSGVIADYANSCWMTATDMNFATNQPPSRPLREEANIRVNCPAGTVWDVGLDNGQNFSNQMRRMKGSDGYISYHLYQDQSRTAVWGNDRKQNTVGGVTNSSGSSVLLTVYGEVQPQPDAFAGDYLDTVVVTIYY